MVTCCCMVLAEFVSPLSLIVVELTSNLYAGDQTFSLDINKNVGQTYFNFVSI